MEGKYPRMRYKIYSIRLIEPPSFNAIERLVVHLMNLSFQIKRA